MNIEKSFDQITKAVSHVMGKGTMPIILGGDHSIDFPCVRGVAENVEGNIGIIHLDRHIDIQEKDMEERMHRPLVPCNQYQELSSDHLVQIGIGGWQVPRAGRNGWSRARNDDHDHQRRGNARHREVAEMHWR